MGLGNKAGICFGYKSERASFMRRPNVLNKPRRRPTLAQAIQALPLATQRLTAEFGMGSGRTTASRSPGKSVLVLRIFFGIHAQNGKEGMHLKCGLELMNRVFLEDIFSFPIHYIRSSRSAY